MTKLGREKDKVTGTVKEADRDDHGARGAGDRNVGGRQADTPEVPELPLDDDGNNARNLGG